MNRRLPPFAALRAFEAAARHSNFTKAALELSISPSAISHQVKQLEDRLGVCPHCPKKENRHSSGCDPMVVAEHSAEALSALNRVMG